MIKKSIFVIMIFLFVVFVLFGCSGAKKSDPAAVTFAYLEALSKKDKAEVINRSCKAWEEQASLEVDALLSVGAKLNNVQCNVIGADGEIQLVKCLGALDLTYNDEIRAIDLSQRTYLMALEDGQWRVCAYK